MQDTWMYSYLTQALLIEVVKATVVHSVKLAIEQDSAGHSKIMSGNFYKLSKGGDKPPVNRFYMITKDLFSYYVSEDHYNYSEDLAIMRFFHSNVAEVALKVTYFYDRQKTTILNTSTKLSSTLQSVSKITKNLPSKYSNLVLAHIVSCFLQEKANRVKYAIEYLKLVCLHENLSHKFGNIVLPLSLEGASSVSDLGNKGDYTGGDLADQISSLLVQSNTEANYQQADDYTLEEQRGAEQRRNQISDLLIEKLKSFFKILLSNKEK